MPWFLQFVQQIFEWALANRLKRKLRKRARAVFFIFKGLLTWLYSKWILIQKRKTEMWAVPVSVFNTVVLRVVLNQDKCFISIRQSAAASALDFSLLGRQRRWTYYQYASSRWLLFVFCSLTPVAPWLNDVFRTSFQFQLHVFMGSTLTLKPTKVRTFRQSKGRVDNLGILIKSCVRFRVRQLNVTATSCQQISAPRQRQSERGLTVEREPLFETS